jgi:hypothetical protein
MSGEIVHNYKRAAMEPPKAEPKPSPLALELLDVAEKQRGRGESIRNNYGPDVLQFNRGKAGNWCAGFVYWCLTEACVARRIAVPVRFTLGAKRLTRSLGKHGRFVDWRTENLLPGDVLAFHRGKHGSWKGHVAIVQRQCGPQLYYTIEGNVGAFPSRVQTMIRDLTNSRVYKVSRL